MAQPLRLRNCHEALLSQFHHFDPLHLVVRSKGLSFVRETKFGIFARDPRPGSQLIRDPESGLSLRPDRVNAVYLFFPGSQRLPVFEFDFFGYGFGISIQPRETPRSWDLLNRIASSFGDQIVASSDLVERGAGAWLDEWGWTDGQEADRATAAKVSGTVENGRISVQVATTAFQTSILLDPVFEDRDGTVRRIAAAGGCDAIVMDANILAVTGGEGAGWEGRQVRAASGHAVRS